MKLFVVVCLALHGFSFSIAQDIIIKAVNPNGKAALFSLSGEKASFIDSIFISENAYRFNLINNHPGLYRLVFDNKKLFDFVYDNNDIEMEIDFAEKSGLPIVIQSDENKIYFEFINLNKDYKTKTELLQLIIARYPETDNYYQITKEKLNQIREEYLYFINVTGQTNPNSFVARYVRSAQLPVVDPEMPMDIQLNYLRTHALDNVSFNDDGLIYSDAFTNKTIEYLTYYRNPQLPLELLEKEFITAVDTILSKAKVNEIVYTHITEYLLDGFKKFGFDNVINYIVENYVIKDDLCLDQKLTSALERRIQQSRNFKVGSTVPNIVLPDSSDSILELDTIDADQILIIFYASWCPHCQTLLPEILNLYKNQKEKKVEVLAISIDTLKTDWLNFIRNNNFDWINASDLEGWNGKAASDYYLYATPTIFLIDQNKKLIQNSPSIEELKNYF